MRKKKKPSPYHRPSNIILYVISPLVSLLTTPVRLLQSLWDSRGLLDGKGWDRYPNFQVSRGVNYCWYWTRARALHRYGRGGRCPTLGLGDANLSKCFYFSLPSLFMYWKMGAALLAMGMFGWLAMHTAWMGLSGVGWTLCVMALALISNYFYCNMFGHQNQHVVGWMFFPLSFLGLLTQNWPMLALGTLLASFGGITFPFIVFLLCLLLSPFFDFWAMFFAFMPTALKMIPHFLPLLKGHGMRACFADTAKALGLIHRNVKYKRTKDSWLYPHTFYLLSLCGIFWVAHFWLTGEPSLVFAAVMVVMLLNFSVLRFADDQSMHMLVLTAATAVTIQSGEPLLLPAYWIAVSPIPLKLNFPGMMSDIKLVMPRLAPFDISPVFLALREFLKPVEDGKRIFMAFDDPQGDYTRILDGYRPIMQPTYYIAGERNIHIMPDQWGVFECNYEGAPEFWGRDVQSALANSRCWSADYLLVYQPTGEELDPAWEKAGFKVLSHFSWPDLKEALHGYEPYYGPPPDWWILRLPAPGRVEFKPDTEN